MSDQTVVQPDPPAALVIHEITFQRNTRDGAWRARCSCGWAWIGTEAEVKTRAAGHDLEWEST
jgi:hypothetical protein